MVNMGVGLKNTHNVSTLHTQRTSRAASMLEERTSRSRRRDGGNEGMDSKYFFFFFFFFQCNPFGTESGGRSPFSVCVNTQNSMFLSSILINHTHHCNTSKVPVMVK